METNSILHNRHYEKFADGTVKDIEDEIPFEVPEGWAWCRLREIANSISSKPYQILEKSIKSNGKYPVVSQSGNFIEGYTDEEKYVLHNNPIVIFGDHTRNVKYIDFDFVVGADGVKILKNTQVIDSKFFYYLILDASSKIDDRGYGRHFQFIDKYMYALPPLGEQKRIVFEIERFFTSVVSLENDKEDLEIAIKQAKSKILDLAIHGKLVSQDSSDEPASVLLERLRTEKEAKIKAGELKRDKNDSYIYKSTTDNCYYEKFADGTEEQVELPATVPESWVWCHFGDVADVINGKNQSKVEDESGIYPIYGSGGIMGRANDYICPENCTIIGRKGSINNPIFVEEKFWNVDTAFGLAPSTGVLPKYLFYFCKYFDFTSLDSSTTLPSLTKTNIQQILFPLPSLSEQQRILNKVESLFTKLDEIILNLV